jgi:uncharacterized phage protein gp47/JayE
MALNVNNFTQIVSNIATAMQASATAALNFTVGSVLRAISEATAGVVLWLQAIILQLLTLTRAATSFGTDLDSWMADYGLTRLAATNSTGQVTFSRFTATQQAVIPINAAVQTSDGTQKFFVTIDATNAAYSAPLGGYILAAGVSSLAVPVQAVNPGIQGNVLAASIAVLSTSIPGVDTVTNAADFTNGIDAESDMAFRLRFVLYLASLSKAIKSAIDYAVRNVQQGLTDTITENFDYAGNYKPGSFIVVVDDGTGHPSSDLINAVGTAIEAVRALGITFAVFAPVVTTANISMTIVSSTGYSHPSVVAAVNTAVTNFVNSLTLGMNLPYTQIAAVAYGIPGVTNVTSVLLNGGNSDVTTDAKHVIKIGTLAIA